MAGRISGKVKRLFLEELFGVAHDSNASSVELGDIYLGYATVASNPIDDTTTRYITGMAEAGNASQGYARVSIGKWPSSSNEAFGNNSKLAGALAYNADGSVTIKNHKQIAFDIWRGDSKSIKYLPIYDAETGGHCLAYFELTDAVALDNGQILVISPGQATATLN